VLTARDTGHGMDRSVRERVFEPFFTTKPLGAGTGLGLAVVHGVMKDHGGTVEVESEPGQGTRVRCMFPSLLNESGERDIPAEGTHRGEGERILLVEDEETLAQVGKRRLESLGYEATVATVSTHALEIFREQPHAFDLVVTDYSMPGMGGLDLAKELLGLRPGLPIVMVTGFMEELPIELLRSAGIRRLLTKPLTTSELGSAIHEVLMEVRSTA
jgi:CheY-like chemotaxis protein